MREKSTIFLNENCNQSINEVYNLVGDKANSNIAFRRVHNLEIESAETSD